MKKIDTALLILLMAFPAGMFAQNVRFSETQKGNTLNFVLANGKVRQSIVIKDSLLFSDTLQTEKIWTSRFHRPAADSHQRPQPARPFFGPVGCDGRKSRF